SMQHPSPHPVRNDERAPVDADIGPLPPAFEPLTGSWMEWMERFPLVPRAQLPLTGVAPYLMFARVVPGIALGGWVGWRLGVAGIPAVVSEVSTLLVILGWMLFVMSPYMADRRVRHPEFFGAVLGGGAPDAEAHPILRAGTLGRNEDAVLQFAARLKALSGEQSSDVLYPERSLRQGWVADARRSRAYRRAKRALQAVDASGDARAELGTLLKAEFRHVGGTTDLYAPSIAYTAALAILLRDAISPADFRSLYAPFEQVIPPRDLAVKR
ncbi:MAG: hypothetical protein ACJ8J0_12325, partial [Longimicrobiaceae bacterium]